MPEGAYCTSEGTIVSKLQSCKGGAGEVEVHEDDGDDHASGSGSTGQT